MPWDQVSTDGPRGWILTRVLRVPVQVSSVHVCTYILAHTRTFITQHLSVRSEVCTFPRNGNTTWFRDPYQQPQRLTMLPLRNSSPGL